MPAQKSWTDAEIAIAQRCADGLIARSQAYDALPHRSRGSVNGKIKYCREGTEIVRSSALPPNDPGYEDGELTERRIAAREGSARLLEALMRYRVAA